MERSACGIVHRERQVGLPLGTTTRIPSQIPKHDVMSSLIQDLGRGELAYNCAAW